jgi:hypothetical protein
MTFIFGQRFVRRPFSCWASKKGGLVPDPVQAQGGNRGRSMTTQSTLRPALTEAGLFYISRRSSHGQHVTAFGLV